MYVQRQMRAVVPFIRNARTFLDFGCGDLTLADALHRRKPSLDVTGVDVIDSGVRIPGIHVRLYNGVRLPWNNNSFDVSMAYHVLHHCADPKASLTDLARVTKRTMIIVEPVWRHHFELLTMRVADRIGNGWRSVTIPMPFTFQKEETWNTWGNALGWQCTRTQTVGVFPSWFPIGVTRLFVFTRIPSRSPKTTRSRKILS